MDIDHHCCLAPSPVYDKLGGGRVEMCYPILDFYIFYKHLSLEGKSGPAGKFFYLFLESKMKWPHSPHLMLTLPRELADLTKKLVLYLLENKSQ